MVESKVRSKLTDLIKSGEINLDDCVIIVSQEIYEQLLEEGEVKEDERVLMYHHGVRVMWSKYIEKPILVTKEFFNQEYNPCGFMKLM